MAKLTLEEQKKLKETYGNVSPEINPETGYPYGAGVGEVQKLSSASGVPVTSGGGAGVAGGSSSASSYMAQLGESVTRARAAALSQKYRELERALKDAEAAVAPAYEAARNREAASLAQSERNFAEFAVSRGVGTGAQAQAGLSWNAAYQANLGKLNAGEASALAELAEKRRALRADYEDERAEAEAAGDNARAEALLAQYRIDTEAIYKAARDNAADEKWAAELAFAREKEANDYALAQAKTKSASKSSSSSSAKTASASTTPAKSESQSAKEKRERELAFEEGLGLFYEEPPYVPEDFASEKEFSAYVGALNFWKGLYDEGAPAIQKAVDYLSAARVSKQMAKRIISKLPGWGGMTPEEMVAKYVVLPPEYGDMYGE
jgi:Mn-containing catalase